MIIGITTGSAAEAEVVGTVAENAHGVVVSILGKPESKTGEYQLFVRVSDSEHADKVLGAVLDALGLRRERLTKRAANRRAERTK